MDAINDKAFAALGAYPIIQSAVAITILLGALYLVIRATRDKPPPLPAHDPVPQWLMIGPMHDMIGAVHDVAEQSRRTNDLLKDSNNIMGDMLTEFRAARQTLEMIRNESRMR